MKPNSVPWARTISLGLFSVTSVILADTAAALESYPAYPMGVHTTFSAKVPPKPGFYLGAGLAIGGGDTFVSPSGQDLEADFSIQVLSTALVYSWDHEIWGGRPLSYLGVPFINRDAAVIAPTPMGPRTLSYDDFTIGDIVVGQALGWQNNKNWSTKAGLEFHLPTGDYEPGFTSNSNNYVTAYAFGAATYHNASNDHFSIKAMLGVPFENPDTNYHSGKHVIVEGAIGKGISPRLGIDLVGFAMFQIEDDRGPSVDPDTGNRTELYGIGPQIRWNFGPNNAATLSVRYLHEFGALNRPEGGRFFIQTAIPLGNKKGSNR
ncbi:transporter [uncultured Tateyamaria sp.]|uniref:SphA family protein n=1 Tax=uncultured Tateyamaria sp. TaxID=455651 RepID=UPI002629592C|nr:transporter [uncultured Tateyamaria sp.]